MKETRKCCMCWKSFRTKKSSDRKCCSTECSRKYTATIQNTPEHKAKRKAYQNTPEQKAKRKAYQNTPEQKAKRKAVRDTPEHKAKMKAYNSKRKLRHIL